jgi:hypothetical protein
MKTTKKTTAPASAPIVLKNFRLATISVRIVGKEPLMVHNFSHKSMTEMVDAQTAKTPKAKERAPRDIQEEVDRAKILDASANSAPSRRSTGSSGSLAPVMKSIKQVVMKFEKEEAAK